MSSASSPIESLAQGAALPGTAADLASDVQTMLEARGRLAELELAAATRATKGFAVFAVVSVVLAIAGLSILMMVAGLQLDEHYPLVEHVPVWTLSLAGLQLLGGPLLALFSWIGYRRRLSQLTQSLDEFKEDVVWLKEWLGQP